MEDEWKWLKDHLGFYVSIQDVVFHLHRHRRHHRLHRLHRHRRQIQHICVIHVKQILIHLQGVVKKVTVYVTLAIRDKILQPASSVPLEQKKTIFQMMCVIAVKLARILLWLVLCKVRA